MKLAIMQPYLFPYIGYFQLISAVDRFVVLDDVNFINKGWVNRNRILVNGKDYLFTVPLKDASQNKLINEIELADDNKWQDKFLKTIEFNYKKAPFYDVAFSLIEKIIKYNEKRLSLYIFNSLKEINNYLNINTEIVSSSIKYQNRDLKAQEKIIDICIKEDASMYINPIGGIKLYSKEKFQEKGKKLFFLKTKEISYRQYSSNNFVSWLSIIDVLMFNSKEEVCDYLNQFDLI